VSNRNPEWLPLNGVIPKIELLVPIAVVHNPARFHEKHLKTFHVMMFKDKQMANTGENITYLTEVINTFCVEL